MHYCKKFGCFSQMRVLSKLVILCKVWCGNVFKVKNTSLYERFFECVWTYGLWVCMHETCGLVFYSFYLWGFLVQAFWVKFVMFGGCDYKTYYWWWILTSIADEHKFGFDRNTKNIIILRGYLYYLFILMHFH